MPTASEPIPVATSPLPDYGQNAQSVGSAPLGAATDLGVYQTSQITPVQPTMGPVGQIRSTGTCVLLMIVTLGIYSAVWFYKVHGEMKRHAGVGLGGGLALLLACFAGPVAPFITSSEVGDLYERRGAAKPVEATTGLWYFPGIFILVGPFIWFSKTNGALNDYWRSATQSR